MESAWCTQCRTSVSLQHAMDELPCPSCGSSSYMVIVYGGQIPLDECDSVAEQYMRNGQWDEAADQYQTCSDIEPSERTLRMATLEWRKDCAQHVHNLADNCGKLTVAELRQYLIDNYDEFVTKWILQEYRGIILVPDGETYRVERRTSE